MQDHNQFINDKRCPFFTTLYIGLAIQHWNWIDTSKVPSKQACTLCYGSFSPGQLIGESVVKIEPRVYNCCWQRLTSTTL